MAGALFVAVFFLFVIVASVVLYYLVRAEHGQRETMDRQEAEQAARHDTRNSE